MTLEENILLKKAKDFAELSLGDRKRKSGELVLDHCLRVAENLEKFKVTDPSTLATAILHHSLSEGAATIDDIQKEFGEDIANMIKAFESLKILRVKAGQKEEFIENLRKMFLVLSKDLRVVLIKLADILDNLTTIDYLKEEKQKELSQSTLDIFAPLAERLGMSEMRGDLQDLAFPYLYPEDYKWVKSSTKHRVANLEKQMLQIKSKLLIKLKEQGIDPSVQSRVKHIYSLYTKLMRPEISKDLTKIHDLIALRIIVSNINECYEVLDIVQNNFKIFPEPISDYIAHPKPNGYQSLHIRVYGSNDLPFEIQIRTRQMHEAAEYGLAAHWNYADQKKKGVSDKDISQGFAAGAEKLDWVRSLSEWQNEITNNQEFLKTVKTDFFGERIFCFTPKGDVKDLPAGATPIDFGFKVHTDLGNRVMSAKVNGKIVPLNHKLNNGDVVELTINKDTKRLPNRDWLNFVVTSQARRKIKKYYS
jgi:GTP diphosphokinase / guanosine-3',5'-bis(diphosphate) 3'-diphosphatase